MPFCPKCEAEYRDGFRICADCDVPLEAGLEPAADLQDVEEAFALEMFAEEGDVTHACPVCEIEFVSAEASCVRCDAERGVDVRTVPRPEWVASLTRTQLTPWQEQEELQGPDGMECVWIALDPAEAGFAATVLDGMGVTPAIGHDGYDAAFEDPSRIGLWVTVEEAPAARLLVPEDPSEWREEEEAGTADDPYAEAIRVAESYRALGKYRHAVAMASRALDLDPGRFEAYVLLGRAASGMRNFVVAAQAFGEAVERLGTASSVTLEWAACSFLDDDGAIVFSGPQADRGYRALRGYVDSKTRNVRAHLLLLEAAAARGAKSVVRDVAAGLERLNPAILRLDGPYSEMTRD